MEDSTKRLIEILKLKDWDSNAKNIVMKCFKILINSVNNTHDIINEYIECIEHIDEINIINNVHDDYSILKNVKAITSDSSKARELFPDLVKNHFFFKKENNRYILDPNGNYYLSLLGYYSSLNGFYTKITSFDPDLNGENFIHEIRHAAQKGFKVSSPYFASAEIQYFLEEGDATEFQITTLNSDKKNVDVIQNNLGYYKELNIFNSFKLLLGKQFIENWRRNDSIDYMKQVIQLFETNYTKDILEKIISIIFFIKNITDERLTIDILEEIKEYYNNRLIKIKDEIKSLNDKIIKIDSELNEIDIVIKDHHLKLNDNNYIKNKANARKEHINELLQIFYKARTIKNDIVKLQQFLESLGEKYDESFDYDEYIESSIFEIEKELHNNYFEQDIKNELNNQLQENKKHKEFLLIEKNKVINENTKQIDIIKNAYDTYNFSLNTCIKTIQMYDEYNHLNDYEKNNYIQNLLIEIQLLFNECINKKLEATENSKTFFNDYLFLIASSIITNKINDSNELIFKRNKILTEQLTLSREKTKLIFKQKFSDDKNMLEKISNIDNLISLKEQLSYTIIFDEVEIENKKLA